MIRRWLIRAPFVAFAMICVGLWAASYWRAGLLYCMWEDNAVTAACGSGRAVVHAEGYGYDLHPPVRWYMRIRETKYIVWQRFDDAAKYAIFGFSFARGGQEFHVHNWFITIPLWFPTFLTGLVLWLIWRKTRRKYNGKAFPVEATAKAEVK